MRFHLTAVLVVLGLPACGLAEGVSADEAAGDLQTLAAAGVPGDGPALLQFFRKRTLSPEDQAKLQATVRLLGHPRYPVRARASAAVLRAGRTAVSALRAALQDRDPEVVHRARHCLNLIEHGHDVDLVIAAARVLGRLRPAGTAETLLNYLPFASDDAVIEAVQAALNASAVRDGKPEAAVLRALEDRTAVKRGAAGEALTRAGPGEVRRATGKLLRDTDPAVRLQVAMAFVESRDRRGVPVLIALLADLPRDRVWPAEELLFRLAGEGAPAVALGGDTPAGKVRDAWADWWRGRSAAIDLTRLDATPKQLGYTLLTHLCTNQGLVGEVVELGKDRKPRWRISNLRYPLDAQVLPRNRVLVAEYLDRRVTERNFKGEVLWEKQVNLPIGCERLPNGNTFIVTRQQIIEVNPQGKTVFTHTPANQFIAGAKRLRNGEMMLITNQGMVSRVDRRGKEVQCFQAGQIYFFGGLEVLPSGRVLIPEYLNNRVVEYDARGKIVWQAHTMTPTTAVRLPSGNTLVASMTRQVVVELNREGKVVWQHNVDGRPFRVRRR
jgi:hypothetical protein